jgi:hypothetical protein
MSRALLRLSLSLRPLFATTTIAFARESINRGGFKNAAGEWR